MNYCIIMLCGIGDCVHHFIYLLVLNVNDYHSMYTQANSRDRGRERRKKQTKN